VRIEVAIEGIYAYSELDAHGETAAAAARMEARAREPASQAKFDALVRPFLELEPRRVLEVGCGTGALAERIVGATKATEVLGTDKSAGMLEHARVLREGVPRLRFTAWDVTHPEQLAEDRFDVVLSSVMVPYLSEEEIRALVRDLVRRLAPGGVLAFIEQDLQTDFLALAEPKLWQRVMGKDVRALGRAWSLGLRPLLREAGLHVEARRSFVWSTDTHGPYTRDLLAHLATDATRAGRIDEAERVRFLDLVEAQTARGDFTYGIVYHLVCGRRVSNP
jgi:SAM-dependent methyltransferase